MYINYFMHITQLYYNFGEASGKILHCVFNSRMCLQFRDSLREFYTAYTPCSNITSPLFLVLAAAFLPMACRLAATKFTSDREVCSFVDDIEGVADDLSFLWAGLSSE